MSAQLRISTELSLPLEAVTETFAIVAKRGKGKTSTGVVMAEEMIAAGQPVVIIDPVGVWWGLRSSADAKGDGLPVVIFGGDHADVPLEPTAGELIAQVLVDQRMPAVIDLSAMSKTASRKFMAPFLEQLYHRNRMPLHVIVDEADAFAPQRAQGDGLRLLGAMEDLVRRGRARGLGVTLITQRPATLHKDVLTQAEVLIALGMTGVRDVAAIDEWVKLHDVEDQAAEVKKSLPSLPVGTAWVWSPGWLDLLRRIRIRPRTTFDSSATPKPGQKRIVPQRLTKVDLDELGAQITATVERAQADNPKALRRRIADLERELAAERAKPAPTAEPQLVEVPVLDPDLAGRLEDLLAPLSHGLASLGGALAVLRDSKSWAAPGRTKTPQRAASDTGESHGVESASRQASGGARRPSARPGGEPSSRPRAEASTSDVPPARRKLLNALVELESIGVPEAPRAQLAVFAGASHKSSSFTNNLGALRTAGLIDYPSSGLVRITEDGRAHATEVSAPASDAELHERIRHLVSPVRWRLLEQLIAAYPDDLDRTELADLAGASPSSSAYTNNLGALRSLGLIDYPQQGRVVAASVLFL